MIKYQGTRKGRKVIGFIIDGGNIRRLKEGKPIFVDLAIFDIDAELMIEFTDDLNKKARDMAGAIGPATLVHDTRNKPRPN